MMLYKEQDVMLFYKEGSERANEVLEFLTRPKMKPKVDYKDRKTVLGVLVHQLINKKKGKGLIGVRQTAKALHQAIDFMDADGGKKPVGVECIAAELNALYHEMYPE
ncbi:hypothetical protein [Bacteroides helcogenes]|uniref:Uncharacterized protein n=1 Tax=Bacteroides helcogenes (strain ATCC 35417 / DSM 20613 / JCM 6297 / CCUG 15421 / P 36-108) TaxID=693979 RepID=E6SUT2_BACT6|nr:hypothetical protein [Bacteroides helcogenes]ADV44427.1 hypothetical protein Bache_2462 [Bacteroides helcogenes P 36-108]MDY5237078.1 hypothetical protein [Bacteroides helcogenes]